MRAYPMRAFPGRAEPRKGPGYDGRGSPARRLAFTLIEMLVVIAIIVVLVSLLGAGIFSWIGSQKSRNTQGTIRTVNKVFQEQWAYVIEQAKKETPSAAVINYAGNDPTGQRARVLWIKCRLIEAFPMSYGEVTNPTNPINAALYGIPLIPPGQQKYLSAYTKALTPAGGKPLQNDNSAGTSPVRPPNWSESSACLLMALSVSRGGSVLPADQLGPFIVDTDGDGINEIIDGWRTPLQFYRFAWGPGAIPGNPGAPNGVQYLNPAAPGSPGSKYCDPLDPQGLLLIWPGGKGSPRQAYEAYAHQISANGNGSTQTPSNYVIPVIVSCGPDQDLLNGQVATPSLFAQSQAGVAGLTVQNAATAQDNIYSFNLKGN